MNNRSTIFFIGTTLPTIILTDLAFRHESLYGGPIEITGDNEWPDGSPAQLRFELNMTPAEADELVNELNERMAGFGLDAEWYLVD